MNTDPNATPSSPAAPLGAGAAKNPIIALLDEVDAARKRADKATTPPHDFTAGEQLDFHRGVDQAMANRFPYVADAYRKLYAENQSLATQLATAEAAKREMKTELAEQEVAKLELVKELEFERKHRQIAQDAVLKSVAPKGTGFPCRFCFAKEPADCIGLDCQHYRVKDEPAAGSSFFLNGDPSINPFGPR